MRINWTKEVLEKAVAESISQPDVLMKLGLRVAGSNYLTLQKYLKKYEIDTSHFIKNYNKMVELNKQKKIPLEDILIENSTYSRGSLKVRLYNLGTKERKCEMCGQDENWHGKEMSLILDHINGVYNDNRLENLRIICPNCNATTETFCNGTHQKKRYYCYCGNEIAKSSSKCIKCSRKDFRKVERPSYEELLILINRIGYSATGRKFGVSDVAVRKWLKAYIKEREEN